MTAEPTQTHVTGTFKHDAPLNNCRFDPTGKFLFATSEDRAVVRWDLETGTRTIMRRHASWSRGLAFSRDGQVVVSSGYDDTLVWWPATVENPEPLRVVQAHEGWIRSISSSPDGLLLASAGSDRAVKLWNMQDGSLVRQFDGHERDVYSTFFHPGGEFLLTGDLKGKVHQWEIASGKHARTFDAAALNIYFAGQKVDYGGVRGIDLSPDGEHLACAGLHKATNPLGAVSQPLVLRFDWESQKPLRSHITEGVEGIGWRALFHPDGFLAGCSGGKSGSFLLFWNANDDKAYHTFKLPGTLRDMDLHADGLRIATAHYEKEVRICSMTAKAEEEAGESF